jgi:chorismate-pyruvate lyase
MQIIWVILKAVLADDEIEQLDSATEPLGLLVAARDVLTDERFSSIGRIRRQRLRKALRNVEFRIYGRQMARRLELLQGGFDDVLQSVGRAHVKHCACSP